MKPAIVLSLVTVGVLLLVLSLAWTRIFTGESVWTPEKATQWAEVKDRLHNLSFMVNSPEPPRRHGSREELEAEYNKVKSLAERLRAEFDSAYNGPRQTAAMLKWIGVALFAGGIVANFVIKGHGD